VLWAGTYDGGLGRYFDGQWTHYNKENGLFDNGVFQILEDSQSNLWMSSNRGIFQASGKQLNDVATGVQCDSVSYGRSHGMQNASAMEGLWPARVKDKNGRLWFPTQEGVVVAEPEAGPSNQRFPPLLSNQQTSITPGGCD
jgi:ligand-binding sensor domain-containing protein